MNQVTQLFLHDKELLQKSGDRTPSTKEMRSLFRRKLPPPCGNFRLKIRHLWLYLVVDGGG
jgi:hypothetical protein